MRRAGLAIPVLAAALAILPGARDANAAQPCVLKPAGRAEAAAAIRALYAGMAADDESVVGRPEVKIYRTGRAGLFG